MKFSLSQAFTSLMVCILKKYFPNVCVFLSFLCTWVPICTSPHAHSGLQSKWTSTLTFVLRKPFGYVPFLVHCQYLFICCSLMPTTCPGWCSPFFLCWHKKKKKTQLIICMFICAYLFKICHWSQSSMRAGAFCFVHTTQCLAQNGCQWMCWKNGLLDDYVTKGSL